MSYIKREAAMKVVADIMQDCKVSHKHRALNRNIKQIPTADVVEVRHGEWKDRYENKFANHYYECSLCGNPALDRTVNNELGNPRQEQALSPFCPNCGAKMDGERREE